MHGTSRSRLAQVVLLLTLVLLASVPLTSRAQPPPDAPDIARYRISGATTSATHAQIRDSGAQLDRIADGYIEILATSQERDQLMARGVRLTPSPRPLALAPPDTAYHTYAEMVAELERIAAAHPDLVQLSSIGTSHEGRTLWMARVSRAPAESNPPEALFIGMYHARERLTSEMVLYLLRMLTSEYDAKQPESAITRLVNSRVIYLVPMLNPDGGEYDIAGSSYRFWRKNRQPNAGSPCIGTDPNRNHSYRWGGVGAASDPCENTYRGSAAASTPEIAAIERFVNSRVVNGEQRIRAAISFHTYGELILWPYGYQDWSQCGTPTPDMPADDQAALAAIGQAMARTNDYTPQQSCRLYTTSGDFSDWAYGAHRIFAYTFEMHPCLSGDCPDYTFYPPGTVIEAETTRNREAVLYLLDVADCPYAVIDKTEQCARAAAPREPQMWLPLVLGAE